MVIMTIIDYRPTLSGVDPYGTGRTCPPIYFGGHAYECPPISGSFRSWNINIYPPINCTFTLQFAATSSDSLQLQRIFFLRNCSLNCNESNYM